MAGSRARPPLRRWLSGLLVSAALVAAVTGLLLVIEPHVPDILAMPILYLLAVLPVAFRWGAGFAAGVAVASCLVFAFVFVPPLGSVWVHDSRYVVALGVFLVTAAVVGELSARWRREAVRSARLTEEQAALRRVATLVAQSEPPSAVFEAVTREVGQLFDADLARMERYEQDRTVTGVAAWSRVPVRLAVGTRFDLDGLSIAREVQRSGTAARLDSFADATGPIAREAQELGIRSAVGCPIVVAGRLWGVIAAATRREEPFPPDTESQIAKFTELAATTIANAESGEELSRLAGEQAALRRVATLVARAAPPQEVFDAVTEETARLLEPDLTTLVRFEPDGTATFLAGGGWRGSGMYVGRTMEVNPSLAPLQAGNVVRLDDLTRLPDMADTITKQGLVGIVGCPITVEGRVWGAFGVGSRSGPFPDGTERRLVDFTELIGTALANTESRAEITRLLDEQAALRSVATLVARGVPPEDVFTAVTDEIGRVLGAEASIMVRLDPDGGTTVVAQMGHHPNEMAVGSRWELEPQLAMAEVLRTGQPARRDGYRTIPGAFADVIRRMGIKSSVAIPITVEGRIWGALGVGTTRTQFPAGTEQRMASFTELVAVAIANTESRAEIVRLLEEQAALRRVATLVATGPSPTEVAKAVAEEVSRLLGVEDTGVCRYEPDGTGVLVVGLGQNLGWASPGTRWELDDVASTAETWRTGSSARFDSDRWENAPWPIAARLRRLGVRSVAASPILVDGRIWGAVMVWSNQALPRDTEGRMASFTELVAMAIGNAESRAELAASRARIVAAADEARRRIERDLHDGAQQRLVSLGLELRLTQATVPDDLPEVQAGIGRVADELTGVLDELREMARGIHPAMLSEGGLGPALRTLARRSAIPVEMDIRTDARFPQPIEVAAYYVVSEAATNAFKHANASHLGVTVEQRDGVLALSVHDDGIGGVDPLRGSGLIGLRDRVEALGGAIEIKSPPGDGTTVLVALPVPSA